MNEGKCQLFTFQRVWLFINGRVLRRIRINCRKAARCKPCNLFGTHKHFLLSKVARTNSHPPKLKSYRLERRFVGFHFCNETSFRLDDVAVAELLRSSKKSRTSTQSACQIEWIIGPQFLYENKCSFGNTWLGSVTGRESIFRVVQGVLVGESCYSEEFEGANVWIDFLFMISRFH